MSSEIDELDFTQCLVHRLEVISACWQEGRLNDAERFYSVQARPMAQTYYGRKISNTFDT